MLKELKANKIYLVIGFTDLRRGIDGLASIVANQYNLNPFNDALYIFCGRRSNRIKILAWEDNGFLLLSKRLEQGNYKWPRKGEGIIELSPQQYRWLLEGLTIVQPRALKPVTGLTHV